MRLELKLLLGLLFISILCSCSRVASDRAQGYIEGRYTYVATSVPGILRSLNVERGTQVKQGQLLFTLEPQPEIDLYNAARENLKQATAARDAIIANLEYARLTYERYKLLVPQNAIQQSQLDSAKSTYEATQAQLKQANATIASNNATLTQATWTKDQKDITAPVDGVVFDTYYRLGEYTTANQAILSLLAPQDIKVIFYVREAVLGSIKVGDKVNVKCDGCDREYTGKISFISPSAEYTPPVIYSDETNYKLIYRIEADFDPKDAVKLHPGQPVTVIYHPHG